MNRAISTSVLATAIGALSIKIFLALTTYGTNDILFFEGYLEAFRHGGLDELYRVGASLQVNGGEYHREPCWHPPFVINYLLALDWLSHTTALPPRAWMKILSSMADFGSFILLARMASSRQLNLVLIGLAPISILVTGFHGGTDAVMIFFLIAATFALERNSRIGVAGALFAFSCSIKLWPLIFTPAFLFFIKDWKKRLVFGAVASTTWIAAGLPYLVQDPVLIITKILSYRSVDLLWGLRIVGKLTHPAVDSFFDHYGSMALFALIGLLTWRLARQHASLHVSVGLICIFFLVATPGFGYQYLLWLTPALIILSAAEIAAIQTAGTVFLGYTYLYYADSHWLANVLVKPRPAASVVLGIAAWMCLLLVLVRRIRQLKSEPLPQSEVLKTRVSSI